MNIDERKGNKQNSSKRPSSVPSSARPPAAPSGSSGKANNTDKSVVVVRESEKNSGRNGQRRDGDEPKNLGGGGRRRGIGEKGRRKPKSVEGDNGGGGGKNHGGGAGGSNCDEQGESKRDRGRKDGRRGAKAEGKERNGVRRNGAADGHNDGDGNAVGDGGGAKRSGKRRGGGRRGPPKELQSPVENGKEDKMHTTVYGNNTNDHPNGQKYVPSQEANTDKQQFSGAATVKKRGRGRSNGTSKSINNSGKSVRARNQNGSSNANGNGHPPPELSERPPSSSSRKGRKARGGRGGRRSDRKNFTETEKRNVKDQVAVEEVVQKLVVGGGLVQIESVQNTLERVFEDKDEPVLGNDECVECNDEPQKDDCEDPELSDDQVDLTMDVPIFDLEGNEYVEAYGGDDYVTENYCEDNGGEEDKSTDKDVGADECSDDDFKGQVCELADLSGKAHREEYEKEEEFPTEKSIEDLRVVKVLTEDLGSLEENAHEKYPSEVSPKGVVPAEDSIIQDGNTVEDENGINNSGETEIKPKKKKKKKKRPKKDGVILLSRDGTTTEMEFCGEDEEDDGDEEEKKSCSEPEPISTMSAISALKGGEVSITSSTSIQIKKSSSSTQLASSEASTSKIQKMPKGKAARGMNRRVRAFVENSDPDGLNALLRGEGRGIALETTVLELVLKAYVMAAMFDDALYCLRRCTLPGTLSPAQTERVLNCLPQNLRNSSAYVAADMIDALCIATAFDSHMTRTYFLRIVRGIALEFLEEATSARDRICSAPCERLVRSAQCVVDAKLVRGKRPTELLVVPGRQLGVFVPQENRGIQAGDAVSILPYAGPYPMSAESLDRNMIEATVTHAPALVLKLQDRANAHLHATLTEPCENNVYRIDKLANRMGFHRQLNAAVAIVSERGPSPELRTAITAMDLTAMAENASMRTPRDTMSSTAAICGRAVPWDVEDDDSDQEAIRAAGKLALDKYGALEGLNESQRRAVEHATINRLTLVQGPPGTGKTAVAIRILQHWARLRAATGRGHPILATSDSNIAVDNLVEGCANVGLKVVRLGRPEAIRPELLVHCVDRPGTTGQNFKEKLKVIANAQVICCTCIGSGGDILDNMTFERVLVDEATQATEPAVLVPLSRGCRQLVLVGDHCQLPPTVLSTRAEEEGLGVPLFSRMVACGVAPTLLDTQYRMHPGIAMFPSDLFYGGKLRNGVSAPERRPLAGFPWPREEFPVAFVPVVHGVEMDDGVSKLNTAEAAAACDAVAALLDGGQCTVSDIAVVTPYAAQVRLLRRLTRKLVKRPPYVEVSSTDGFQGREKEAVIFSAVRSNPQGSVGFVADWRRVNVSFTRARRALIVIGNDVCLRRGDPDTWMPWLAWADAHGIHMDKPGVPRGRYDAEQLRRVRGGTTAAEMLKDVLERQQAQRDDTLGQMQVAERRGKNVRVDQDAHLAGSGNDNDVVNGHDEGEETESKGAGVLDNLAGGCWDDSDDENDDRGDGNGNRRGGRFNEGGSVGEEHGTIYRGSSVLMNSIERTAPVEDAWDL